MAQITTSFTSSSIIWFIFKLSLNIELGIILPVNIAGDFYCPGSCRCHDGEYAPAIDCTGANWTGLPPGISQDAKLIDLGKNEISELPDHAFSQFAHLTEIRLPANNLAELPPNTFAGIDKLIFLYLEQNKFKRVPAEALQHLRYVKKLILDANQIEEVPADSFQNMQHLMTLNMAGNRLKVVPSEALWKIPSLKALTLERNEIGIIENNAFISRGETSQLQELQLSYNLITDIKQHAFDGLRLLNLLELKDNQLKKLPNLKALPSIKLLGLSNNLIENITDRVFSMNHLLTELHLRGNRIRNVGVKAFIGLSNLKNVHLSEVTNMVEFPDFTNCTLLRTIQIDRAKLKAVPNNLCKKVPALLQLDVHSNDITKIPDLSDCKVLRTLNFGQNEISTLSGRPFRKLPLLVDLVLEKNHITTVPEDAFCGLTQLEHLNLNKNNIKHIDIKAFKVFTKLKHLNVAHNRFSVLPTEGLAKLEELVAFGNTKLQDFPHRDKFPSIQTLSLEYAYHCCAFQAQEAEQFDPNAMLIEERVDWLKTDPSVFRNTNNSSVYYSLLDPYKNMTSETTKIVEDLYYNFGDAQFNSVDSYDEIPPSIAPIVNDIFNSSYVYTDIQLKRPPPTCIPMPGPFMPCDDLMGWWSLRCGVWIVFLLAVFGNGVVLFVLVMSRTKMDVPRFLICNLAVADFMMGIYLGFLAIVDASTLGEFRKYAIKWQHSAGCLVAGFLGVLSSELSVFTLTVITVERFYAITHAMHLNKRLSIRHASYIMALGWCLALLLSSLPLFGISDYKKFAVCLPFEIGNNISLGYVCFIMFFNTAAFIIIVTCYMKMYCSVRGSQAWNSNDSRVAKRMALLVFTDFLCWAPITFFSLSAAFGLHLISLNDAKVFTIFILPLNSCANPFLYAIFTKQFKKDCMVICKRFEETTVARNLSRLSQRSPAFSWGSSVGIRNSGLQSYLDVPKHADSISYSGEVNLVHYGEHDGAVRQVGFYIPGETPPNSDSSSGVAAAAKGAVAVRQQHMKKVRIKAFKSKKKNKTKKKCTPRRNSYAAGGVSPVGCSSSTGDSGASASSLLLQILQAKLASQNSTDSNNGLDEADVRDELLQRSRELRRSSESFLKRSSLSASACSGAMADVSEDGMLSDCPNNNHDYVNITEDMLKQMRGFNIACPFRNHQISNFPTDYIRLNKAVTSSSCGGNSGSNFPDDYVIFSPKECSPESTTDPSVFTGVCVNIPCLLSDAIKHSDNDKSNIDYCDNSATTDDSDQILRDAASQSPRMNGHVVANGPLHLCNARRANLNNNGQNSDDLNESVSLLGPDVSRYISKSCDNSLNLGRDESADPAAGTGIVSCSSECVGRPRNMKCQRDSACSVSFDNIKMCHRKNNGCVTSGRLSPLCLHNSNTVNKQYQNGNLPCQYKALGHDLIKHLSDSCVQSSESSQRELLTANIPCLKSKSCESGFNSEETAV